MKFDRFKVHEGLSMYSVADKRKIVGYVSYAHEQKCWYWTRLQYKSKPYDNEDDCTQELFNDYLFSGFNNLAIKSGEINERLLDQMNDEEKLKNFEILRGSK